MDDLEKKTKILANDLVFELNKSMGFRKDGLIQPILKPLVWKPMIRFSELATVFDYKIAQEGFQEASAWFISHFVDRVKSTGVENVPIEGPLVIASNHPGAYDSMVITAHVARNDVKFISSDIPFLKKLPESCNHMIVSAPDPYHRMGVVRKAIRHLKNGGAILVFARGSIDPDPAFLPGYKEEIDNWTSSLGLFLQKVPQAKLTLTMVSNVLAEKFIKHPATLFRKGMVNKQRLSEFFQVMHQLLNPGKLMLTPNLSFAPALSLEDLGNHTDLKQLSAEIINRAHEQLDLHISKFLSAPHQVTA